MARLTCDSVAAGHQAYFRRLLYEKYFRPNEAATPPDERELLKQIEGFGAFRPAQVCAQRARHALVLRLTRVFPLQFADPVSAVNQRIAASGQSVAEALPAGAAQLHLKHGEVYAEFVVPDKLTLEQRRQIAAKQAVAATSGDPSLTAAAPKRGTPALPDLSQDIAPLLPEPTPQEK